MRMVVRCAWHTGEDVAASGLASIAAVITFSTSSLARRWPARTRQRALIVWPHSSHALACSKLSVDGDVALAQRAPLRHDGSAVTLMESALQLEAPGAGTDAPLEERTSFASLLAAYKTRNETTVLDNAASVWEGGSGASGCTLSLRLRVPPAQRVAYIPGALETVKHAWVQFIAVYVIFWWLLRKLEWVVFHYRILPTRTVDAAGMKKTL